MRKLPLIAAFFLSLSLAFGQIGSNSITVTASQSNASSLPDQAVFSVQVTSGLDSSAKVKDTITTLSSLQAKIAAQNNGLALSFSIQGTQSSAQPAACSLTGLLASAQTQAQNLADGAGASVGKVLAMASPNASVCTLTVKFALVRN